MKPIPWDTVLFIFLASALGGALPGIFLYLKWLFSDD